MLPDRVRLGAFDVDLRTGEVRSGNGSALLQEKSLRVLQILLEHDGELVTREEIQKRLWPNDTIVDFERGINTAISRLRQALSDAADEPKYIETIPRRGYRLLVPVEPLAAEPSSSDDIGPATLTNAASLIGKKVSHYRVLQVIGGGGMGLVYEAEDLKLGRRVALKFLPEEWVWDAVALQRFEREAQTASSLNHPNICTIYEIEEYQRQPFIAMELLEGQTLRDRLSASAASKKTLPLNELLEIAIQICAALQAAHEKGIIHRDIKPANVFLTSAGHVKVLDFGLAKLICSTEEKLADAPQSEPAGIGSATQPAKAVSADPTLTRVGVALGTAGYMSPEQIRGEKLDARTDLFSFGLVLYEMATGQRAFTGETAAVVHDAIVNQALAPARQVNPRVPARLDTVIDKSLRKDCDQRYQSAADLGIELRRVQRAIADKVGWRWRIWVTVVVMMIVGGGWFLRSRMLKAHEIAELQLTANPVDHPVIGAAISPDGKYVAYHDQTGLYLRAVDSAETHLVPLPPDLRGRLFALYWSPVGESLIADVFSSEDGYDIWLIPLRGDRKPRLLYQHGAEPAVSPDGRRIAFVSYGSRGGEKELWVGDVDGDSPQNLVADQGEQLVSAPTWSPDGKWVAYARKWKIHEGWGSAIEARPATGGPAKTVLAESRLPNPNTLALSAGGVFTEAWLPDWRLIFVVCQSASQDVLRRCSLWNASVNPTTGETIDNPEQLSRWWTGPIPMNLTFARDSSRLALIKIAWWNDVYLGDLSSDGATMKPPRRLTLDDRGSALNAWTPDSKSILFSSERDGRSAIYKQGIDDDIAEKIVDAWSSDISPDGLWLLYEQSQTHDAPNNPQAPVWLMRRAIRGGPSQVIAKLAAYELQTYSCSSDPHGSYPCVIALNEDNNLTFYVLDPVNGKGKRLGSIEIVSRFMGWNVSPNGSELALVDEDKYPHKIKILTFATSSWREIAVEPAAVYLQDIGWSADGKGFFAISNTPNGQSLLHVTMDGKVQQLFKIEAMGPSMSDPLASPDGRYVAFGKQTWNSNVWILDHF
jgi:serine/threonine protein kinase/Tol biopolymer transport system component